MLLGASIGQEDVLTYGPKLAGNNIMRIFPADATVGGKAIKVLQPWTDSRIIYCKNNNVIPFVSSKVDGYAAGLTYVKNQLLGMPDWLKNRPGVVLWITDRHEPEGDLAGGAEPAGADTFKNNFKAFVDMLDSLPADLRAKIWVGPVLTKTFIEKAGTTRDYDMYDPMSKGVKYGGDFFGVDMYHETGTASAVVKPSTIIAPATFVAKFKAYKYNSSDTRPRIWPELGLIGMPEDTDGSARATWIQGIYDECKKMQAGQPGWTQPWNMRGFIWWHQIGKATGEVRDVGQARDFPLHLRSQPLPDKTYTTTDPKTGKVTTHWVSKPVDLPGSPPKPLAKFNQLWTLENTGVVVPDPDPTPDPDPDPTPTPATSSWTWRVGATMKKEDIPAYRDKLTLNAMTRVFPNPSTHLPPSWTDERFVYCRDYNVMPFVSSNIDGDSAKFATMKSWILNMPQWLKDRPGVVMFLTDRHEPENNFKNNPSAYITNYTAWYNAVIKPLPADIRAKIMVGPVLTRQWIEGGATKGNNNYQQYDPGPSISDFYGVDMYMDSWDPAHPSNVATSYKDPVAFLSRFKAYRYNNSASDTRLRLFPELGAIGIPTDPTGSQRAAWLQGICAELDTWTEAAQGWKFGGFCYWNNWDLTGSTVLNPIGTDRYFFLDQGHAASSNKMVPLTSSALLNAFNTIAKAHYVTTGGPSPGMPGQGAMALRASSALSASWTGAPIPPPVVVPPISSVPASGPAAARALQAIYTVLITDPYLEVVGDPLTKWSSLQVTLRWKEPGSGQLVIPADSYVREQLLPGNRVVVLRRVLGTQHRLISGPIEDVNWEASNDADDNAGVGKLTITFAEDLAWLGARLSYPNPDRTPDQQTNDYWLYTGNPEQGMLKLVNEQAGPAALPARQVPKLIVAPYSGLSDASVQIVGTSDVNPREKYEKVTDVLRRICTLGANSLIPGAPVYHRDSLGFRTRQTVVSGEDVILFEPLRSRDLSGEVHFSFGKGNLKYFSFSQSAPTATALVIGGSGDGSDALVREVVTLEPNPLKWGRFEAYKSEQGSEIQDNAKLQAVAQEAFADSLSSARLSSNASDVPDQRYGVHYNVGDIVSVVLAPGQFESAPVQTVALQAYPTAGEVVSITIGDQGARYDSPFIERFRELDRRLGRIERRGER
jgi:Siphovirus ReqiPepy6 Gp37-like protein